MKIKDNLKTPVYVTQNRKNAMGVGMVFVADLKTEEHVSHWILQGTALVLNIDYWSLINSLLSKCCYKHVSYFKNIVSIIDSNKL